MNYHSCEPPCSTTYIGTDLAARLSHRALLADAINRFGDDQHPVAMANNLQYFAVDYAVACIDRASPRATESGRNLLTTMRAILTSSTTRVDAPPAVITAARIQPMNREDLQ